MAAEDAIEVDTTGMTIEQVVTRISELASAAAKS
jgi:cytidylate kinase